MNERSGRRAANQASWTRSKLSEALREVGITLVSLEGQIWSEGDAVEILNAPGEGQKAPLRIVRMVEPIVMDDGQPIRLGKATVEATDTEQEEIGA